jgi:hypothetical protein
MKISNKILFVLGLILILISIFIFLKLGGLCVWIAFVLLLLMTIFMVFVNLFFIDKAVKQFKSKTENEKYVKELGWMGVILINYIFLIFFVSLAFSTIFIGIMPFTDDILVNTYNNQILNNTNPYQILNYNLVTISTLGYGNVIPIGLTFETISSIESLVGVGINVIIIALIIAKSFKVD